MTDTNALKQLIADSGIKYAFISKELGISPSSLYNKVNNITEFTQSEIEGMCAILHITKLKDRQEIFFAKNVHET